MRWLCGLAMILAALLLLSGCLEEQPEMATPTCTPMATWAGYSYEATLSALDTHVAELDATMMALLPTMDSRLQLLEATAMEVFATASAYEWSCPTATPTPVLCARCSTSCPEGYFCKECAAYIKVCVRITAPNADCQKCLEQLR